MNADYQKDIGYNDLKTGSGVYFYAKHMARNGNPIVFDDIITNIGGAMGYDGYFTAPVDGIYYFQFNVIKDGDPEDMWVYLQKGQEGVGYSHCPNSYKWGGDSFCAVSATLQLKKGEKVHGYTTENNPNHAHFTGYLLEQNVP